MKQLEHKRALAARILLSVFLPMLVCLSLHVHQRVYSGEGECYECAHHLPHHGHLSVAQAAICDCLLCQLGHVPFMVPLAGTLFINQSILITLLPACRQTTQAGLQGLIRPRAPPSAHILRKGTISFM